jgi:hypothetical protein
MEIEDSSWTRFTLEVYSCLAPRGRDKDLLLLDYITLGRLVYRGDHELGLRTKRYGLEVL